MDINLPNAVKGVTSSLTLKNILTLTVMFIIVSLLISFVMRNEVILYDANGNVAQKGETKPRLKFGFKKQ